MKIHWQPQPKQEIALQAIEDEILYGGARGGGKTDAGQAWLLYDIDKPRYRALVIRRNATDLDDWIDRAKHMFLPAKGTLVGDTFIFPSGAKIRTGHLKDDNAYTKYQGHEYQKLLLEEITHIASESNYEKLLGSVRSTIPEIKPQIFATTNPDGPGYKWVKRRWGIPDTPTDVIRTMDEDTGRSRIFIPSRVQDNPKLMETDPGYIKYLESIQDEDLKKAWLEGSWTGISLKGAYYRRQIQEARDEGRITSVPYEPMLPVYTWWDLGVGDSTCIGFFQLAGREVRMIDYFEASGEGLNYYASVLRSKGYVYAEHYAPHDIEVRELGTGKSRREIAANFGIDFRIAPNISIDDGINAVRMRFKNLWIDERKCEQFVDAISQYQKEWNDKMGDFKARPLHDWTSHAADMIRYWAVTTVHTPDLQLQTQIEANRVSKGRMFK
jgi:hypothetical protein